MGHTRLPSRESSRPWRLIHPLVRALLQELLRSSLTNLIGLQTPRLKRLAEIVSAQAIAQQEKLEFGSQGDDYDNHSMNDLTEVDEGPETISASA